MSIDGKWRMRSSRSREKRMIREECRDKRKRREGRKGSCTIRLTRS